MPVNAMPLWFKAKRYGWGWYPSAWQGWAVTAAYIAANVLLAMSVVTLVPGVIVTTSALLYICWKKGERPRWRWGGKDETKNAP